MLFGIKKKVYIGIILIGLRDFIYDYYLTFKSDIVIQFVPRSTLLAPHDDGAPNSIQLSLGMKFGYDSQIF